MGGIENITGFYSNKQARKLYALTPQGQSYVKSLEGDSSDRTIDVVLYALYNRGASDIDDLARATHVDKERVRTVLKLLSSKGYIEVHT